MRSLFLALTLTAGAAFAQAQGGPGNVVTPEQNCQMKCAQNMQKCMEPCMPKDPGSMDKAGGKGGISSCAKSCAMAQSPCMAKCKSGKNKGGEKGSDGP